MNPRILAAIAAFLSVIFKTHLSIVAVGLVISVSVPWFLLAAAVACTAVLTWMVLRSARGFRSSPYLRTAS